MIDVTFPQTVTSNENNEFFATASITTSGTFQLHLKEGTNGIQNSFLNSPITLTITPAITDPERTTAVVSSTVPEDATKVPISIFPRDEFGNPSAHDDDEFSYFWAEDNGGEPNAMLSTVMNITKLTEGTSVRRPSQRSERGRSNTRRGNHTAYLNSLR